MRRSVLWITATVALACPALAQDAQTFLYDGNGRLVSVTTARPGANGAVSSYLLDDADNRAAHTAIAVTPPPSTDKLAFPYTLVPTQKLTSANGLYTMMLDASGDLVIASSTTSIWHSCTGQGRSTFVRISSDGRLGIYDPTFVAFWTTPNSASPGAELTLQNNGLAVLKSSGGTTLWNSSTQCQ